MGRTVSGAVLMTDDVRCHIDIVESDAPALRLYQFVPKCVDIERHRCGLEFSGPSGRLRRDSLHLEVIALRVWAAQRLYPQHRIIPLIVVPVRGELCAIEGMHDLFQKVAGRWQVTDLTAAAEAARLLRVISVASECAPLVSDAGVRLNKLNQYLAAPTGPEIGYRCRKCDFRVAGQESGYERCWRDLAHVTPHMFDLTYLYFVQENGRPVADRLAREGKVSLWDVPEDRIFGDYAPRQNLQLDGTETGSEIILPELADALSGVVYPLRCLDIETLRSWLPAHRGEQVNELVLFQFSVHTRASPTAGLEHLGWLNTEKSHPNGRFLAALRAALGDEGTVCIWTRYEEVSFTELLGDLISSSDKGEDFQWLRRFLASKRILDLHDVCFRCHFHPLMKGRTSIKAVLPALWSVDTPVKHAPPYSEFPADTDPYAVLKSSGTISDGCLAMEGYLDIIGSDNDAGRAAQAALERYCRVDTLAMFYVLDYWAWRLTDGEMIGSDASPKPLMP